MVHENEQRESRRIILYSIIMFLTSVALSLVFNHYTYHQTARVGDILKSILFNLIYEKVKFKKCQKN